MKKQRKPPTPPVVRRCRKCKFLVLSNHKTLKARKHSTYKARLGRLDDCSGSRQKTLDPMKSKPPR